MTIITEDESCAFLPYKQNERSSINNGSKSGYAFYYFVFTVRNDSAVKGFS